MAAVCRSGQFKWCLNAAAFTLSLGLSIRVDVACPSGGGNSGRARTGPAAVCGSVHDGPVTVLDLQHLEGIQAETEVVG
ncbi:MAG: hypothetical protein OQL28_16745, partial [Sedimenticola sp.]|nr:hypothetical protein [Sedimenticola sp.]